MQFTIRSATDLYPRIDEWESAHTMTMAMLDNLPLYNMASVGFVLDPPEWPGCWSSVLVFSRSDLGWDASGHMYWLPQDPTMKTAWYRVNCAAVETVAARVAGRWAGIRVAGQSDSLPFPTAL